MSMPAVATGLARYGLHRNPYQRRPLDPLTKQQKLELPIGVVGGLRSVEDYITRAIEAQETAFVLVQGKSGTGRTSICNHLLRHHCDERGIDTAKFVVPKQQYSGQDSFDIFKSWIVSLYGRLQRAKLTPLGHEGIDLDAELSSAQALDPSMYALRASAMLAAAADVLDTKSAGFGVCFENVKEYDLVTAVFEAFAEARTLVLMTVLDYPRTRGSIRALYERHPVEASSVQGSHYPTLDLEPIRGEVARDLIQFHWRCAAPGVESPFSDLGVAEAFDDQSRPAGRVVALTQGMLDTHAGTIEPGPSWPEDRDNLTFTRERLGRLLPIVSALLPEEEFE